MEFSPPRRETEWSWLLLTRWRHGAHFWFYTALFSFGSANPFPFLAEKRKSVRKKAGGQSRPPLQT